VRFTCEKCGRAYAADEGLAVRGFRIRCRQCGELIVVPARGAPPGTMPSAVGTPVPTAQGIAEALAVALQEGKPRAAPGEIAVALREGLPRTAPGGAEEDPFASLARELAAVPEAPPLLPEDPWLAAPPGGGAPDAPDDGPAEAAGSETDRALAEIGRRMDAITGSTPLGVAAGRVVGLETVTPPPRAAREPPPAPVPPAPARARPVSRRWIAAGVGLAAGVAGAVAIALLLDRGSPPEVLPGPVRAPLPPPAPAPPAAAAPARPAPETRPAPARQPDPRGTPPRKEAGEDKARVAAARPAGRPAARPKAPVEAKPPARTATKPPAPPAPPEKRPPVRPAAPSAPTPAAAVASSKAPPPPPTRAPAPRADRQLGDLQIQATIARHADAFQACAEQARRDEPQLLADTRRVTITMTVTPGGRVLYPTLDDAELSGSALGGCLKREAGRMGFPPSEGEAVRVRMPLVLR
jgi:hypothetical protein